MIDWDAPIELDNGARAEVVSKPSSRNKNATVRIWSGERRGSRAATQPESWSYSPEGVWCGGNRERYFYIVNSNTGPLTIEDWRL